MKKRLMDYIAYAEQTDAMTLTKEQKEQMASTMLVQIGFFQHERLIHLIVTITFAILMMLAILCCYLVPNVFFYVLTALFFVLLVPYVGHYYRLENGVQKLYELYDRFEDRVFQEKK